MPLTDLPLDQLRAYRPEVRRPADLDAFWADTIAEARAAGAGTAPVTTPAETPVTALDVQDLTFPGFGGDPVRAWVSRPAARPTRTCPSWSSSSGTAVAADSPGNACRGRSRASCTS